MKRTLTLLAFMGAILLLAQDNIVARGGGGGGGGGAEGEGVEAAAVEGRPRRAVRRR